MKQVTIMASIKSSILFLGALSLIIGVYLTTQEAAAASVLEQMDQSSSKQSTTATLAVIDSPEVAVHVLESLLRSILYSVSVDTQSFTSEQPQKRGLDLGISRGFSGSQAGKHLMGLSAASFANGPGR